MERSESEATLIRMLPLESIVSKIDAQYKSNFASNLKRKVFKIQEVKEPVKKVMNKKSSKKRSNSVPIS